MIANTNKNHYHLCRPCSATPQRRAPRVARHQAHRQVAGCRRLSSLSGDLMGHSKVQRGRTLRPPVAAMLSAVALAPLDTLGQTQTEATLPEVKVTETTRSDDYGSAVSTVGGGIPTPIRDIPQSVTVVNSALM